MFGLVALVVVAATAFIGAGSASASVLKSVLCKVNQELCKAENLWGKDVTIVANSAKAVLLGTLPVTCKSSVTLLTEKEDEHLILGKITSLTWTNCEGCKEVTTTTLPTGSLLTTANAAVATLDTTSKTVVLLKGCTIFNIECTATAEAGVQLAATGGTIGGTAQTSASEVPVKLSGGLCGTEGKWDAGSAGSSPYVVSTVNGNASGSLFFSLKSHAL
jgi:hypothetical protein